VPRWRKSDILRNFHAFVQPKRDLALGKYSHQPINLDNLMRAVIIREKLHVPVWHIELAIRQYVHFRLFFIFSILENYLGKINQVVHIFAFTHCGNSKQM